MSATIDVALVPAFVEVVRQGSFTAAARALGLPKSTVSRRVSKLEASLGTPLLVRSTRSLRLTEAGEAFFARAAPALEAVAEAATVVTELEADLRGLLRVTVPVDVEVLAPIVARFAAAHPALRVEVIATARRVDLIGEGVDVAVRAGPQPESSLITRRLTRTRLGFFASHAYLEARPAPASLDALLRDHEVILFRPTQGVSRLRLDTPDGARTVELRGQIACDEMLFLRGLVLAGAGVGLLPAHHASGFPDRLVRVLPEVSRGGGAISIVYPPSQPVPAKVRAFRDFLVAELALD